MCRKHFLRNAYYLSVDRCALLFLHNLFSLFNTLFICSFLIYVTYIKSYIIYALVRHAKKLYRKRQFIRQHTHFTVIDCRQ